MIKPVFWSPLPHTHVHTRTSQPFLKGKAPTAHYTEKFKPMWVIKSPAALLPHLGTTLYSRQNRSPPPGPHQTHKNSTTVSPSYPVSAIQTWIKNTWGKKFQKTKFAFAAHRQLFTQHLHGTETCKMGVWSLGQRDPLEKGTATHPSILTWEIPRTEEPGRLWFKRLQRVRHDWATNTVTYTVLGIGIISNLRDDLKYTGRRA